MADEVLYWASRGLQRLIYPLDVSLLLLAAGFLLHWRGRRRLARCCGVAGFTLLLVASLAVTGGLLHAGLEADYPPRKVGEYPEVGLLVLLGGGTHPILPPQQDPESNGPRMLTAARLYQAGKADRVLVVGGGEYEATDGTQRTEADDMAAILGVMGVPQDAILFEDASRTTYENAREARKRLADGQGDVGPILLVTSAFHMRRAKALFEKQGFEVIPAPCEPYGDIVWTSPRTYFVSAENLNYTTRAIKEYVGFAVYRLLGRL